MIKKLLIANRGEIAVRIIRTAKEMGIKTVAIYSEADKNSLHVEMADEAICIGPPKAADSYLNIPSIMAAAEVTKVDAIHPGYGFLSENPTFAEIVQASNIKFVGPPSEVIELSGDKVKAKEIAKKAGVPVVPGSDGEVSFLEAKEIAHKIGYPVVLKAAAGGGGRGIRIVRDDKELLEVMQTAMAEAKNSFGDERIYIEKYLINPKHIEVQILSDGKNVITLGERECSLQRRHQKIIEESPSASISDSERELLYEYAIRFAKAINYIGAGTVEFLYTEGQFYFIEMNARIQVEHPVTEMTTGIDIVSYQLLIADEGELDIDSIKPRGFAIECRINAEDPITFIPSVGVVEKLRLPGGFGVRVDTHLYQGYSIPQYYDSLLAKIIAYGKNKEEAINRMKRAINETKIEGKSLKSNLDLHRKLLDTTEFKKNEHHVRFLENMI
ncbi:MULTISPECIES: acetyl-CoA carboxylase biotin carboxylase subunit [unclassified Hydrogenobaculum]|uniref:acetyl-CoA carboxylase biotin carboxylase subunit n=1 Tax=unclassified Hydrogenobaculum TaxID=2622382 RepID=UPI0001C50337|nr:MULTISPECIES: acetyl-CoA carboxylase biotin carboxylase subunit [unclassified Hydrogenobaculum]AEF19736.1 acetyl-CoA carboxylase, biotin carboxylase [Hydrogenobaculum sp. 3684]AEG47023.1 acetyl-CoA carboxylase, biotin carboxylase [Hydrogenobaculum sp. SHO]AGG15671.1 acetyl-CoA carboxylase, biotin carboxylase [Hydrogenobaculum sp. HO]AGH93970.1 acetyl/propionyl-CoA carboxylase, alpha subunit [Hydrogenobaculum sp. SN]